VVSEEGLSVGDLAEGETVELAIPLAGSAPSERALVGAAFCRTGDYGRPAHTHQCFAPKDDLHGMLCEAKRT
jgi:hypothetical protein